MQCERYSAGLTSRPASSSTTFAPASHNCFVMTPPAAPEPITHTSYFTAAIPGIILERDLAPVKEPPAAYCPRGSIWGPSQPRSHSSSVTKEGTMNDWYRLTFSADDISAAKDLETKGHFEKFFQVAGSPEDT